MRAVKAESTASPGRRVPKRKLSMLSFFSLTHSADTAVFRPPGRREGWPRKPGVVTENCSHGIYRGKEVFPSGVPRIFAQSEERQRGRSKHRARGVVRRADPEDHHFRIPCSVVTSRLKLAMMRVFTLGIVKLQIVALLSSPLVELVVKNLSAHHLALAWSFISPEFMVYTSPLLPSANRDVHD